jgi:DNA-binding Lrp family transcriptional regulator
MGQRVQMLVMASLKGNGADIIDRFKKSIKVNAEVMDDYYVRREADFMLVITTKDTTVVAHAPAPNKRRRQFVGGAADVPIGPAPIMLNR